MSLCVCECMSMSIVDYRLSMLIVVDGGGGAV